MRRECIIFFQVLLNLIIWLVLSLFDCVTCLFAKKKSYKKYRSFKRSYIETFFTIIKNKIQIQMSVLFPNIFETKQYATYPSNRYKITHLPVCLSTMFYVQASKF
jgi:hypothetical protein